MQAKATKNKNNEVFEKLYGRPLDKKEIYEIRKNIAGFFEVLVQIEQGLKKKGALSNAN